MSDEPSPAMLMDLADDMMVPKKGWFRKAIIACADKWKADRLAAGAAIGCAGAEYDAIQRAERAEFRLAEAEERLSAKQNILKGIQKTVNGHLGAEAILFPAALAPGEAMGDDTLHLRPKDPGPYTPAEMRAYRKSIAPVRGEENRP